MRTEDLTALTQGMQALAAIAERGDQTGIVAAPPDVR
jgi:hypothetical protein